MRLAINVLLGLIVLALIYLLVGSIQEPIAFKAEKDKREDAVVEKLKTIRTAQEAYRGITGEYTSHCDSLLMVLKSGEFKIVKVIGDPDDPSNLELVRYDTIRKNALDSLANAGLSLSILENMCNVPYSTDGAQFEMTADTLTYQKTLVNVIEVGIVRKHFMGEFANPKFKKYDDKYDPYSRMKFGSLESPNLGGNWE